MSEGDVDALTGEVLWTVYSRIQPQLGERSLPILLMTAMLPEVLWAEAGASRIGNRESRNSTRKTQSNKKEDDGESRRDEGNM